MRYLVGDSALEFEDKIRHEVGTEFESDADLSWWVYNGFLTEISTAQKSSKASARDLTPEVVEFSKEIQAPEAINSNEV